MNYSFNIMYEEKIYSSICHSWMPPFYAIATPIIMKNSRKKLSSTGEKISSIIDTTTQFTNNYRVKVWIRLFLSLLTFSRWHVNKLCLYLSGHKIHVSENLKKIVQLTRKLRLMIRIRKKIESLFVGNFSVINGGYLETKIQQDFLEEQTKNLIIWWEEIFQQ